MHKNVCFCIILILVMCLLSEGYTDVAGHEYSGYKSSTIFIYTSPHAPVPTVSIEGIELEFVNGQPQGLSRFVPEYFRGEGSIWVEIDADGLISPAERTDISSSLRREVPVEESEITEDMSIEMRIGNPGEDFMVESDRTGFGDPAPNERVTVAGAMSMQGVGSTPTAESGYGKVYVDNGTGHLMFVKEDGSITDLTVDANAVQSVSSSANPTGRTEHMRFIPGDMTEITESATNDTIYIRYDLSMSSTGCSSAPAQPDPVDGITPICSGERGTSYGVAPVENATYYRWTVPSGATITDGFGTNIIHAILGDNDGDICVRAVNACGESSARCFAVTINRPTAPGSITGDFLVCNDTTGLTYSIEAVPEATNYIWTVPAGAVITGGSGTNEITVNFGTTDGEICVQTENSCGRSEAVCASITMTELPVTPGSITGTTSLCEYTSSSYSIASVPEASYYVWSVPAGASISSGAGTTTIDVLFGNTSGNISVAAQSICGTSSVRNLFVSVINPPAMPGTISGSDIVPPSTTDETYSISPVSGATSYLWTITGDATIDGSATGTSINVDFGTSAGSTVNICVTASNTCGTSSPGCKAVTLAIPAGNITFNYTGSVQTWTVPAGVSSVTLECWGAEGGRGYNINYSGLLENAGRGGYVKGTLSVTPGDILYIYVGGEGEEGSHHTDNLGGWNGGGAGSFGYGWDPSYSGGAGGGASDVRYGGNSLSNRVIVGGGGGGGSYYVNSAGGYGGYPSGGNGTHSGSTDAYCGRGGTQSAGGAAATSYRGNPPAPGSFGVGGHADLGTGYCGCAGGGAGGWYGGGGGGYCNGGGGGGGSSYFGGVSLVTYTNNTRTGNGLVIVSWGS